MASNLATSHLSWQSWACTGLGNFGLH
jgi:hypothetical protein